MFRDDTYSQRTAELMLDAQDFEEILFENSLTIEDVLKILIDRGLIEVWIDVGPTES